MDPKRLKDVHDRLESLDDRLSYRLRARGAGPGRASLEQIEDRLRDVTEYTLELRTLVHGPAARAGGQARSGTTGALAPKGSEDSAAAGRAEAAFAARARSEILDFDETDARGGCDDQLREPLAAAHGERLGAVVDQQHADLSAIVAVDGARRVEQRQAELGGEAAARPDLPLPAGRESRR